MKKNKLDKIIEFNNQNVYTAKSPKGYGYTYFAKRDLKKGEIVISGFGKIVDHQTPHISIQIDHNKHYLPLKLTGKYWNHSCNPNTHIKTRSDGFPDFVATKNIKKGEEITYAYWMSEHGWIKGADENFVKCVCGEETCFGIISSFSQLQKRHRKKALETGSVSKYLKNIYNDRKGSV
ncbi:MAG: SET domain-containing protein-lysine N-methyltransferase [Candidatus Pacebacteria bacterium]|nr:SET domain-containing protein-lysine N-methyltransferase [Candidatus Paceibacterota bacterium]MDD5357140.1 SET domain-containing protein-lysine N-methyltransferase [Candidatus Paceibacterota bacterium]